MMKWIAGTIMGLAFALTLWVMIAATQTVKILGPVDLAVLECNLRLQGNQARVISGCVVQTSDGCALVWEGWWPHLQRIGVKKVMVLNCQTDNGQVVFTWVYPLGTQN